MLDTEKERDYLLLSSSPFDKTITPSPSMDATKYLYVGSGSSDDDPTILKDVSGNKS